MRIVIAVALVATWFAEARADHTINAVIGDVSWAGRTDPGDEVTRIRAHLTYVHALLAKRDVSALSATRRQARATSLAHLARYIERGVFPRRTGDGHAGRRPRFIDDRGVHCAVGQLIADSGRPELARSIDARFEYAHVREMNEPALVDWADSHGFTVDELAMIQPTYRWLPTRDGVRRMIVEAKDALALECARTHAPMKSLLVRVFNDEGGATTVSTKSRDPFAQCFVRAASQLDRGGHAYMGGPEEFSFGIDLAFTPPQEQLEARIARWQLSCSPHSGPISRRATVEIASAREGLAVRVVTTPSNPIVDACITTAAKNAFADFGAGIWSLRAQRRIEIVPHVRLEPETLEHYAKEEATACEPSPAPEATTTISVSAKPDDPRFAITATGSPAFAACMATALNKRLATSFRASYQDGAKWVDYFRIDADVRVVVTFALESGASRTKRLEEMQRRMEQRNRYD